MGSESTVTGSAHAVQRPAVSDRATVTCDQAVFSSVPSRTSGGYHFLAMSAGLTPAEKKEITVRSPSHGGLCQQGPGATAIAFYPLSTGRLCLAYSRDAGAEYTGRGVRRIHTHLTVVKSEDFGRFAYNPFCLFRAVGRTGALEVRLEIPSGLSALRVETGDGLDVARMRAAVERVGTGWLAQVLYHSLQNERVVVGGEFDACGLMEAVLLGLPGPLRAELSFSTGLNFSNARKYLISAVSGDLARTRRLVYGQRLQYVEPESGRTAPDHSGSPWIALVQRRSAEGRFRALADLTSQPIPDWSEAALARIGSICNDTDAAGTATADQLIEIVEARLEEAAANDFESTLHLKLVLALQSQLCSRLRKAEDAGQYWPALSRWLQASQRAANFALPAVQALLERLASRSPVEAAACATEAAEAFGVPDAAARLRSTLEAILEAMCTWLDNASPHDLERARTVLHEWRFRFPSMETVTDLLSHLEKRGH